MPSRPVSEGGGSELAGHTLYANCGGASFTARAAARVMSQQGIWNGRELVRRAAFRQVVTSAGMPKSVAHHHTFEDGSSAYEATINWLSRGLPKVRSRTELPPCGCNVQTGIRRYLMTLV